MMFGGGGGGQQAPPPEWNELHFHQKLASLMDSTCDFVCDKATWWVPTVGAAAVVSLFFFGQDQFVPQTMMMGSLVASPFPATPAFAVPEGMGEMGDGGMPMPGEDDFAELDD